jgi:hypothetical protein
MERTWVQLIIYRGKYFGEGLKSKIKEANEKDLEEYFYKTVNRRR